MQRIRGGGTIPLTLPPLPVIVLLAVFVLIAVRRIGNIRLQIWQIVLAGAIAVLLTGQIGLAAAASYIDMTVIFFLIGIFIVGAALTESGYLQYVAHRLFRRAKSVDALVLLVLLSAGVASMFLLNDTLAVIGTPVVMYFALKERINPKLMLLALAFAVTIGSVASPIGNPQNLLIASSGLVSNPFPQFFGWLIVPTVINLLVAYLVLKLFFRKDFSARRVPNGVARVKDAGLAKLCKASLAVLLSLIALDIIGVSLHAFDLNLAWIAMAAALPILLFSDKRLSMVRNVDWTTIIFFISLFVLVGSVWESGYLQGMISGMALNVGSVPTIFAVSIIGSQFVSNVPMVLLYLKMLSFTQVPLTAALALAAGSTIAGNLLILGAASNVIIIQSAERRYHQTVSFVDFAKVGALLTVINAIVYWAFLSL